MTPSNSKSDITELVAKHGSSSATAWIEFDRYKIWRPSEPISESSFAPVQGYMQNDPFVYAWGNPLVSDPAALAPTARAFAQWATEQGLRPVWCCVDEVLEQVLANEPFQWSVVRCIHEDVVDAEHVVELVEDSEKPSEKNGSGVKDLKKNLRRAERAEVEVKEVKRDEWTEEDKRAVEEGVEAWKKSRNGTQIASTALLPWLDEEHRRYWISRHEGRIVGLLILTPMTDSQYMIKNAVSFPDAPKGASEYLIFRMLADLKKEDGHATATFGITASNEMEPAANLGGMRVTWLSKTYKTVAQGVGLTKRGDFRSKFDSKEEPMYVCYPSDGDGLGMDGINKLMKLLKK